MRPRTAGLLAALLLAGAVHADWHFARPHHSPLSGDWSHHWLLGVAVFAALGVYLSKTQAGLRWRRSALVIGAGLFLGQVLEPLGEGISMGAVLSELHNGIRWTAFGEFLGAGLLTFLLVMAGRERIGEPGGQGATAGR